MPDTQTAVHEEAEQWAEEPLEELPPRPRRRLFTPIPVALFGVLLLACGFIGGVLVEKGQTSSTSSSSASGLASKFAALRAALPRPVAGSRAPAASRDASAAPAAPRSGKSHTSPATPCT